MASTQEYIDYVCAQLEGAGVVRCRRMMGEAVVYVDEKCAVMVCDDICYVKKVPELEALMADAECGCPYEGAKEHYILDIDHRSHAVRVARVLAEVLPYPKKKGTSKKTEKNK